MTTTADTPLQRGKETVKQAFLGGSVGSFSVYITDDNAASTETRRPVRSTYDQGVSIHTASGDEDEHSPRTGGDQQGTR